MYNKQKQRYPFLFGGGKISKKEKFKAYPNHLVNIFINVSDGLTEPTISVELVRIYNVHAGLSTRAVARNTCYGCVCLMGP